MKISIIICYNNIIQYEEMLKNIESQEGEYEIIGVDNRVNEFSSCSKALNYGAAKSSGEILIFAHQDLEFLTSDALIKFSTFVENLRDGIVGVAGYKLGEKEKFSTIVHGKNKSVVGKSFSNLENVESVDECLFGIKRSVWKKYRFDEEICDDWHLYAVEFALRIRLDGLQCVVVPIELWHKSSGNMNDSFYVGLKKLMKRYKKDYKYIYTTCVQIRNTSFGLFCFRLRKKLGKLIHGVLGK